ncbi:glycosyltransferase family 4 protein [Halocatena salina]|uniref:glycosyltransferase family 4 protein n=1 Tax=Halocatena salina TaxID=2934340 RepID=UPI0024956BE2|nr:glycosyltransferase family 4 protein [Halocatena salina]
MTSDISEKKILHVITRSDWGGAPRIVQLLADETAATTAVACGPGGKLIDRLRSVDVPVFEQPHLKRSIDPISDVRALYRLRQLIRRESFDLVHCHSTKAGALGRIAAAMTGTPSIFTVHGWGFYNTEYEWLSSGVSSGERALARLTDAIVCVSENDRNRGRENDILRHTTDSVIHNGIAPVSFSDDRATIDEEIDRDPETVIIGAIARLAPQKDPMAILETGARLQRRGTDVTVVIIGSGSLTADCREYIDDHDVDAHLLGFHQHALELLADIDVFLLPSRFEGFPLTVLECLHLGVPIVAYDVGGVSESIVDGETGFLVEPADLDQFVERVEKLVSDDGLREEMATRSRRRSKQFTVDRMVRDYEDVYADVLDCSASHRKPHEPLTRSG